MKPLTEFVGTFIFLFVISLAAVSGSVLAPLAIGLALTTMVYMGGHWSGAHYNPAVSFAVWLARRISFGEFLSYVAAQLVAGTCAFLLGWYLTNKTVAVVPGGGHPPMHALIVEIIFTLALVLVVLNVAVSKKTEGKGFYGLAIGLVIVVGAISAGPISGGAFNPAVGLCSTIINVYKGGGDWQFVWIPIVGPLVGAMIGQFIWSAQEGAAD